MKQNTQDEGNTYLLHRKKNKRKSGIPVKNPKPKSKLGKSHIFIYFFN